MAERQVSYSLKRAEYIAGLQPIIRGVMMRDRWSGWAKHVTNIAFVLQLIVCAGFAYAWSDFAVPILALGLVLIAIEHLSFEIVGKLTRTQTGTTFDPERFSDLTVTLKLDGVHQAGPDHRQFWAWPLFRRLHEENDVLALEFAATEMLVVPRRAFASRAEAKQWISDLREKLPQSGD